MPQPSAQQILKRTRLSASIEAGRTHRSHPDMAISRLSAVAIQEPVSKRSSIIVRVTTDAGIEGIAEMDAGNQVEASLHMIRERSQSLIGRDALGRQTLLWEMANGVHSFPAAFQAAANMALLDIAGKRAKAPVYQVVSGQTRSKARALTRLEGRSDGELRTALDRAIGYGHRAFLIPLNLPEDGIRGRRFYRDTRQLLDRLRESAGEESDFALDCQGRLKASQAAYLAKELESFRLLWLDEPCSHTTNTARTRIAVESVTPVGLGRFVSRLNDFQDWLRDGSIDVVRPDVRRLGMDAIRKLSAHAETHYVALAPVNTGGPIATVAGLHLAASTPNFFIQEIPLPADSKDRAMRGELLSQHVESVESGFLALPEGPGLGITLNEDALKRYEIHS